MITSTIIKANYIMKEGIGELNDMQNDDQGTNDYT